MPPRLGSHQASHTNSILFVTACGLAVQTGDKPNVFQQQQYMLEMIKRFRVSNLSLIEIDNITGLGWLQLRCRDQHSKFRARRWGAHYRVSRSRAHELSIVRHTHSCRQVPRRACRLQTSTTICSLAPRYAKMTANAQSTDKPLLSCCHATRARTEVGVGSLRFGSTSSWTTAHQRQEPMQPAVVA
ncbi:hypothetical protein PINS_up009043 [Pythium insidiosum]|nr:hypothetical protein PINS_up009043 [Pythium insidiosum]